MKPNDETKNRMNGEENLDEPDIQSDSDTDFADVDAGVLEKLLERERERTAELTDQLQRSQAEIINYRRRMEQEQGKIRVRAVENTLRKLLPVADDFHRALKTLPPEAEQNSWVQGFRLIETNLWKALEAEGVSVMDSIGNPFDPARHEAVVFDENTSGEHMVVEEFQRGYLIQDRVLRPAMVKVGSLETDGAEVDQLIDIDSNR